MSAFDSLSKVQPSLPERPSWLGLRIGDVYKVFNPKTEKFVKYIIGLDHPMDPISNQYHQELENGEFKLLRQPGADTYRMISLAMQGLGVVGAVTKIASGAKWLEDEIWSQ
ncbi:MAG: hypothetical protein LBQ11_00150 [Candidatus Nomurabacteria bacterium]|jgi:hypothetical protein|nr:hypothetical protein [Candidatus Nomurabacteria bacterium]